MADSWRIVAICSVKPLADALIGKLRDLGHEPVALLAPRRPGGPPRPSYLELTDASAPEGLDLLPRALERIAAGDPGDPQPSEDASWAGHFEDDDYVRIDWAQSARAIHNQVRAWHLTFGLSGLRAPIAELEGEQVVVLQTRLTDPGGDARRVECGDGPLWVVATEPV